MIIFAILIAQKLNYIAFYLLTKSCWYVNMDQLSLSGNQDDFRMNQGKNKDTGAMSSSDEESRCQFLTGRIMYFCHVTPLHGVVLLFQCGYKRNTLLRGREQTGLAPLPY